MGEQRLVAAVARVVVPVGRGPLHARLPHQARPGALRQLGQRRLEVGAQHDVVPLEEVDRADAGVVAHERLVDGRERAIVGLMGARGPAQGLVVDEHLVGERDPLVVVGATAVGDHEARVRSDGLQVAHVGPDRAGVLVGEQDVELRHAGPARRTQRSASTCRNASSFIVAQSTRTSADSAPSSFTPPRQGTGRTRKSSFPHASQRTGRPEARAIRLSWRRARSAGTARPDHCIRSTIRSDRAATLAPWSAAGGAFR